MKNKTYFFVIILILNSCTIVKTDFSNNTIKEGVVYYYLPETQINIKDSILVAIHYKGGKIDTNETNIIAHHITTSTDIIADTDNLLTLKYNKNGFSNDELKYIVNQKGLLETIKIISEDRSPEIIEKLKNGVKDVLLTPFVLEDSPNDTVIFRSFVKKIQLDYKNLSEKENKINFNILIQNEVGGTDYIYLKSYLEIKSNRILKNSNSIFSDLFNENKKEETVLEKSGILTRPLRNAKLFLKTELDKYLGDEPLPININVIDNDKLVIIPIERNGFVKRENNISISNGVIISNEIKKPSSVEGFISIPINIAKAIVSIPAQIVQFKFDNTSKKVDLEKKIIELDKTKLDNAKNELDNKIALENYKIAIQKEINKLVNQVDSLKRVK